MAKKTIKVRFKKLNKNAVIPFYAHPGEDAAMDMTVTSVEYIPGKDSYMYGTGLACATETLTGMFGFPRSSNGKHNFYLSNHVGIIDPKGYRGEIKAEFKNRDSLNTRITNAAMDIYDALPWYKKLRTGTFKAIKDGLLEEFNSNPLKYAPYKPGDVAFQIVVKDITPVVVEEVEELDMNTARGTGGFGSTTEKKAE